MTRNSSTWKHSMIEPYLTNIYNKYKYYRRNIWKIKSINVLKITSVYSKIYKYLQ